jgi:hypothetical protein
MGYVPALKVLAARNATGGGACAQTVFKQTIRRVHVIPVRRVNIDISPISKVRVLQK